jgi:phenylalanyl-tRNA synthetase beta chain
MHYSYNKLKQLSGTEKSAEELSALLMTRAFEVESLEMFSHGIKQVVIGLVHSVEKHPNADKLNVAQVETEVGSLRQIVCGAPNLATGQKVAVALPGARLPSGIEIKESKIRDVDSQGMICSEKELGLGDGHEGILVLPEDAPIGKLFVEYAELEDTILDVKVLPDRGADALSYRGLAREIAAIEGRSLHFEESKLSDISPNPIGIEVVSPKCSRYAGLLFEDVHIGSLPVSYRSFLFRNGLRSISAPVDITNFFLLEYGQPMHAFDADKIEGKIVVRQANEGETLALLSGTTITLEEEDLVIADEKKALALAGVMGGIASSVTEKTTRIFLEVAIFDAVSIRRTRVRHHLATDASYRYERGLDPNMPGETFVPVAGLFTEYAGANFVGMTDVYPNPIAPQTITLPVDLADRVLGASVGRNHIISSLESLDCEVSEDGDTFQVTVPTRRRDLSDEWNLVEEIGRIFGYENIPAVAPMLELSLMESDPTKTFERSVKHYLTSAGFDEVMSYSFYGANDAEKVSRDPAQHLAVENPLSPELSLMRSSVLSTLIMKAKENLRYSDVFQIFEFGSAYTIAQDSGVHEEKEIALISVAGREASPFASFKGKIEALLSFAHQKNISFEPLSDTNGNIWHPSRSAQIMSDGQRIGTIGEIAPFVLSKWGIKRRLVAAEFSVPLLSEYFGSIPVATVLPRFPFVMRDISLFIPDRKVTVAELQKTLSESGAPLLQSIELFDRFEKEHGVSLAFHLAFGSPDRTHTLEEVEEIFSRMVAAAKESCAAELNM